MCLGYCIAISVICLCALNTCVATLVICVCAHKSNLFRILKSLKSFSFLKSLLQVTLCCQNCFQLYSRNQFVQTLGSISNEEIVCKENHLFLLLKMTHCPSLSVKISTNRVEMEKTKGPWLGVPFLWILFPLRMHASVNAHGL